MRGLSDTHQVFPELSLSFWLQNNTIFFQNIRQTTAETSVWPFFKSNRLKQIFPGFPIQKDKKSIFQICFPWYLCSISVTSNLYVTRDAHRRSYRPGHKNLHLIVEKIRKRNVPIWGEAELGYRFSKGRLAVITGTNGKTTTTALLGEICRTQYESVFVVGNIGNPCTSVARETRDDSVIVAEMSSFQLESIEEFHPQSLNTIRVVTISNKNKVEILDAEFRMGIGENVVDNASCGGILASINVVTGALIENGVDMFGNEYVNHPGTGKAIKGFMIPHWDEIVRVCKEAATVVQGTVFVGWDVCVRQNGEIELIEANAFPGVIGLQTARKQGLKPRLQTKGKEILGYNPLNLISVWSKSYVRFLGKYGYYY